MYMRNSSKKRKYLIVKLFGKRSHSKQLNYQVLSFLGTIPHIHENMMLPKSDVFLTLRNDGPSMDERDKHWSMAMHGDGSKHVMIQEKATDEDFRTLRPP